MKCLIVFCVGMLSWAALATPTVSDVVARQRYPWNGMVDIDYTITGDASGCKLDVIVEDKQNGKRYVPTKFLSAKSVAEGAHRLTWSTEAEGVTIISTNVSVSVSLARSEKGSANYYVIDLSGGLSALSYPVSIMSEIPGGEWTDEYKSKKLVLKRIDAGGIPTRNARISKPLYVGVFEITIAQWNLVMSSDSPESENDIRAKSSVSFDQIRGSILGAQWPASNSVDAESFLGKLREKTGIVFDLPTQAQWEYACRAGTASAYNNGGDSEADLATVARYYGNRNDGRGGYEGITKVGCYAPNAWGLYDMHGNVSEWCLDWDWGNDTPEGDDPVGPDTGAYRIECGGGCLCNVSLALCSAFYRNLAYYPWCSAGCKGDGAIGFRIFCPAGL